MATAHGLDRFPLDVPTVALEAARIFGWSDPISKVQVADIKGFEGALFPNESRSEWLLLYNSTIGSAGRIRFTQAHELGHYILHRASRSGFQCGDNDISGWPGDQESIETQADTFASYLLMPIDDFRAQTLGKIDLNVLSQCAERYGVSLSAAILKWLQFTDEKAILVMSSSGFMNWAWSSESAWRAGAFFRTKAETVEIPAGTLASDDSIRNEREGKEVSAAAWFKFADPGLAVREMKLRMEHLDRTLTLLVMPKIADVWPPYHRKW